jgi:D-serine deaminase-like pyridoxal phosphate-dependent protein
MAAKEDWYTIKNADELDSPALLIYPERVKQNVHILKSMIDDVQRLRPHVKTNKTKEATRLLIEAGISKFKCATIAEAEMLGICEAGDVLLAYQPVGPKLKRFVSLIRKYPLTRFSCLTDHPDAAQQMAAVFSENGLTVPVYVDLNTGQNRTGIAPGDPALRLYISCSQMKGIKPIGLHVYDGHIRDVDFSLRKKNCDEAFIPVESIRKELIGRGFDEPIIVAGGTPSYSIHCKRSKIECSPGTFIFWDRGYTDLCPEQPFLPAALVLTRVISLPDPTKICVDLGHKSIGAENILAKRVFFLNAPELKGVSQSEEHLVLEAGPGHSYKIGDLLYGHPFHICPTVALYERGFTVENHFSIGEWRILARDRKIFL